MSIERLAEYFLTHEAGFRLGIFLSIFAVMATWEVIQPCRELWVIKSKRWLSNILLMVIDGFVVRLLFPAAAVGVAHYIQQNQIGVFNQLDFPLSIEILVSILVLDFLIYWQHMVAHHVPIFWQFHRVHHADLDFDVTTGARFHPVEIILSMLLKFLIIVLLGPPAIAVFLFEVILNGAAMFNHSNVSLPKIMDRLLRLFLVTPDMHRVHHSVIAEELNSNFGFNLTWWDRLFGTYRQVPKDGQTGMTIGMLDIRKESDCVNLLGLLKLPFKKDDIGKNQ